MSRSVCENTAAGYRKIISSGISKRDLIRFIFVEGNLAGKLVEGKKGENIL